MNPIQLKKVINDALGDNILDKLPITESAKETGDAIEKAVRRYQFVTDPFIEQQPLYKFGDSLTTLVENGVLHPITAKLFALSMGQRNNEEALKFCNSFHFYEHQQHALEAVLQKKKNLVVCSGTGSGKTECFLLPLIDYLVREKLDRKVYDKGVRALLLYPLNALVNDQLRRLRGILKHCRDIAELKDHPITFGRFTGETPIQQDAPYTLTPEQEYRAKCLIGEYNRDNCFVNDSSLVCYNEVCRRSEWCDEDEKSEKGPADILVTNYAMLERLLLKPDTSAIFTRGGFWKFIILDEAHSYDGSKGTEIAWLIRRLNQRVHKKEELSFLATSATLVDGNVDELKQVLKNAGIVSELWQNKTNCKELKEIFIKHAFASKIFPAAPESFFVEFGRFEDAPEVSSYKGSSSVLDYMKRSVPDKIMDKIINDYGELKKQLPLDKNLTIMEFLPWFWATERFWNQLLKQFPDDFSNRKYPARKVKNLLHAMLSASGFLISCPVCLNRKKSIAEQLGVSILQDCSKEFFSWTLEILECCVGSFDPEREEWKELLHDNLEITSRLKKKYKTANRLYLLDEWIKLKEGDLFCLSMDGLEYMLRIGHECLVAEAADYSPEYLPLWLTEEFLEEARTLREKLVRVVGDIKSIGKKLEEDIAEFFGFFNESVERTFGDVLLAEGSDYLRLRAYINDCHVSRKIRNPSDSEFSKVAKALFPNATEDQAKVFLNELNTAASFGKDHNNRPLWDIRYHQMVRGIPAATIQFEVEDVPDPERDDADADYRLTHPRVEFGSGIVNDPDADKGKGKSMRFSLGLCLNCGQPYLIGFAKGKEIGAGLQLHPNCSAQNRYMHALSWVKNGLEENEEREEEVYYLDPYKGRLYGPHTSLNDSQCSLIAVYYYAREKNGVISKCPCCSRSNETAKGTKDGIITLYSGIGDSNKTVAIAAILEQLPSSLDPEARAFPGSGRKLLAFSDSRHQAAKLSLDFDKYICDRNIDFLLHEAMREKNRPLRTEYRDGDIPPAEGSLKSLGLAFRDKIVEHQLIEQYLMLDYKPKDRSQGVKQMTSWDASNAQLIRAFRRKSFHKALDRAEGYMDYEAQDRDKLLKILETRAEKYGLEFDREEAEKGFFELLNWLFVNSKIKNINNDHEYPETIVYPGQIGWYKNVVRKKKPKSISFENSRKLREVMKVSLKGDSDKIKKCLQGWLLDDVWKFFTSEDDAFIDEDENLLNPFSSSFKILPKAGESKGKDIQAPLALRVEEHSAQIESKLGSSYQEAFAKGLINMLSCSTTFEMGVDLGDLSCVFLCNQPPSAANYKQRAGRAGRRVGMGAIVFTFIGKDSHDTYYFDHPEKMFFGTVVPPMIYLDNPVFLARHLRAEALHRFLKWDVSTKRASKHAKRWESVGWFFFGISARNKRYQCVRIGEGDADCWIADLKQWAEKEQDSGEFNNEIYKIIGKKLDYDVVKDLVWQLTGEMPPNPQMERDLCYRLAGPNMSDQTDLPLKRRILQKLFYLAGMKMDSELRQLLEKWPKEDTFKDEDDDGVGKKSEKLRHLFTESTISYLANNRILPRYGFPSDEIELKKDENDDHIKVELSRDMKLGIYEYALGKLVMANKRVFESDGPRFYNMPRLRDIGGESQTAMDIAQVCLKCKTVFEHYRDVQDSDKCEHSLVWGLRPDFFQALPSVDGQSYNYARYEPRIQTTPGKVKVPYNIEGTHFRVSEYIQKKVVYLNTNNGEGFPLHRDSGGSYGKRYCLMHTVHTDVLQLQLTAIPEWRDDKRIENTWASVAAALQRAMQTVLKVQKSDIGILPNSKDNDNKNSWAIYDSSPGGAGFVYRLLLSDETSRNLSLQELETRVGLIKDIIREAIRVCKGRYCQCYQCATEKNELIPGSLGDVIENNKKYRHPYSCYNCLRDFTNKSEHDILDVADAAYILELMLDEKVSLD